MAVKASARARHALIDGLHLDGRIFHPGTSTDATKLDVASANAVAKLAEQVGPGTGTIAFKSDNSAFS